MKIKTIILHRLLLQISAAMLLLATATQCAFSAPQPAAAKTASAPATSQAVTSAPSASRPAEPTITEAMLNDKIRQLEETKDIDAAVRKLAMDNYAQAREQIKLAAEWQTKAVSINAMLKNAKVDLEKAQARLAELSKEIENQKLNTSPDTANAQDELQAAHSAVVAATIRVLGLRKKVQDRKDARISLENQSTALRDEFLKIQDDKPVSADAAGVAYDFFRQARIQAIREQSLAISAERNTFNVETYPEFDRLLTVQQDIARKELELAKLQEAFWKKVTSDRRRVGAEAQLQRAEAKVASLKSAGATAATVAIAADTVDILHRRIGSDGLVAKIDRTTEEIDTTTTALLSLRQEFRNLTERVNTTGLTEAIGLQLRNKRREIPDISQLERAREKTSTEMNDVRYAIMDMEDLRAATIEEQVKVNKELARAGAETSRAPLAEMQLQAELLQKKLDAIDVLRTDYTNCIDKLYDLDTRQGSLIDYAGKCAGYIDERILWIRSSRYLGTDDGGKAGRAAMWLVEPENWTDAARTIQTDVVENPWKWALAMPLLTLLVLRWWFWKKQKSVSRISYNQDSFTRTLVSVALTIAIAISIPLALAFVGWRLAVARQASEFPHAIGAGLEATALVYMTMAILLQLCRPEGLAEIHFQWPADSMKYFRNRLRRIMPVALPLVFIVITMESQAGEYRKDSLGRFAFIALMLTLAIFLRGILRPGGKIVAPALARVRGGWIDRLRHFWYLLVVLAPLALAVMTAYGYYYTAVKLATCLLETTWLIMALAILNASMLRWLSLAKRALLSRRARIQSSHPARTHATLANEPASDATRPTADEKIDLPTVDRQTRQFLRYSMAVLLIVGGWFIWADVAPALGVLRDVSLWNRTVKVSDSSEKPVDNITALSNDNSATKSQKVVLTYDKVVPVTLADVLLAVGVGLLTMVASKNIPGLMEITILQRLPWEPGGRYAFVTVLRYIIIVVGVVITFGMLGVSWSSVQWLAAAVTVGLGFGLQEIFANFVSGLILLFERPMRVGDVVTVGEVSGKVTRIHMRATTITDWDRKELIVPNKEFITGRLINWTLSDNTIRLTIPVGAAYGTDVDRVLKILLKCAADSPMVLKSPAPTAHFDGFGDSALNFNLRMFLPSVDNMPDVKSAICTAIGESFKQEGIEMPFPQRDIHIRSDERDSQQKK